MPNVITPISVALLSVDNPDLRCVGGKHVHLKQLQVGLQHAGCYVLTRYLTPQHREDQLTQLSHRPKQRLKRFINRLLKITPSKGQRLANRIQAMAAHYQQDGLYRNLPQPLTVLNPHDAISGAGIPQSAGPVVLTLHGYLAKEMVNYNPDLTEAEAQQIQALCQSIEAKAYRRADAIIAVDSRIKDALFLDFGVPLSKITIIHNAVDTDRFVPVDKQQVAYLREQLGLPVDAFVVLCPRRLVKKNGVEVVAHALKRLHQSQHPHQQHLAKALLLVIIGDGPEHVTIESILVQAPASSYRLLPALAHTQVLPWVQASDVICVPSITANDVQEATSLTMLEGMACGKPVVCSDIGGMREVLRQTHEGNPIGLRVPEDDPQALLGAWLTLFNDQNQQESLGTTARKFVEAHHSIATHSEAFMQVFASVR
jgi:glycosyltransferase involved in cell wall biosynthesis